MRRGKLVCLVGIDGAGKTTVSRLLVETLNGKAGYRYVWGNLQPWLVHGVVAFFRLLKGSQQAGDAARERIKSRRSPWLRIYYAVLLADYVRHVMSEIALSLWRGQNVIVDRYAFDVAVSIGVNLGWDDQRIMKMIDRLLLIFPQPSALFYLDVPAEVAFKRKDDVPSLDFLLTRQVVYEKVAERYGMTRLDGTKKPGLIVDEMIRAMQVIENARE